MQPLISTLEPAARVTVATLFNSLWEAALLGFAVWLILRLLPNLNATTRYAAWCVALLASLLLPLGTAIPQITVQHAAGQRTAAMPAQSHAVRHTVPASAGNAATVADARAAAPASGPVFKLPGRLHFALPEYAALALFGAWAIATLLLLIRLGVSLWRLERLKADALPLPVDYRERLAQWTAAEKGGRDVRLCICEEIEVPVAVGLFDSMILIPQHLLDTLAPEEIDQIMLHELGHLRRADDWTNGLQRVVQALFFFNPAVLYIAQQLDIEREVACDDWVVDQTKNVRPYATCLTKMAEATAWPHRPLAAPGVFVTRRGLSVRVERLLRAGRNIRTSVSFGPAGAVVAALVVLFFLLQTVAPTFAFTLPEAAASPAATAVAAATPSPAASASPSPRSTVITIPARHIHVPARTIPPINIDMPKRTLHVTVPAVPLVTGIPPKNFKAQIQAQVKEAMRASMQAMNAAQSIKVAGGKFNCVGCDYSGQQLSGLSFRGQRLNGSDFSHADLHNADFSNTVLVGVDFAHANLRGAKFTNATINGCNLSHADVAGVNFDGVSMIGCSVDARSLEPSQARALLYACHMGCDFSGADLRDQDLHGISLSGVDLNKADLRGADLTGSTLNGVNLRKARLDGARFRGATLTGCDLSGVDLNTVDLSDVKMSGDKLSKASIR